MSNVADSMNPPTLRVDTPASSAERWCTIALAAGLLLLAGAIWPQRLIRLGPSAAFFGAYGALLVTTEAMTAVVLAVRAHSLRDPRVAILAGAYAFSAPLIFANVVTLPTVVSPFHHQTPPWLWLFWHIGWALGIAVYAWIDSLSPSMIRGSIVVALSTAFACIAIAISGGRELPALLRADDSWTAMLVGGYVVALALNVLALIGFARRGSRMSSLDVWVAVAVIAVVGEIFLISTSLVRFSVGTYVGRVLSVISGAAVFASVLGGYVRTLRRTALLEQHASLANASPEIVFMTDENADWTYVNRRWSEVTGQAGEVSLGSGWLSLVHAADAHELRAEIRRAFDSGTPMQHEFRISNGGRDGPLVSHARHTAAR